MTLTDLASVGSLISSLVVLVSLVFLGLQIRQAQRAQLAAIRQQRTDRMIGINLSLMNADVAPAVLKGAMGDLNMTPTEQAQHSYYCRALSLNGEDSFSEHQQGLLDQPTFEKFRRHMKATLGAVGVRARWKRQRTSFDPAYTAFIDDLIASTPATDFAAINSPERWQADIAAERATITAPLKPPG